MNNCKKNSINELIYYDLRDFFRYITNISYIIDDLNLYKDYYPLHIIEVQNLYNIIFIKAIISYEEIKNIDINKFKKNRQYKFKTFNNEPMYKQLDNKDLQIIFLYEESNVKIM